MPTSLPLVPCLPSKGGIRRDLSRLEAAWGFYPDCENVIYHRGEFRARLGLAKFGDTLNRYAAGSITFVAKADLVDGETFTISDGTIVKVFEFDVAGDGVVGGRVQVNVSGVTTAIQVAGVAHTAINAAEFAVTSTDPATGTLILANDARGSAGNVSISDTVADLDFTHIGMGGGGGRPAGMISYPCEDEAARLVAVTSAGMAHYNASGDTWTDLTDPDNPLTGGAGNAGVLRVFQTGSALLTIAINGKDEPVVWENEDSTHYRKLGCEVPRTAKCQVVCSDRLVFGNIQELGASGIDFSAHVASGGPDTGWGVNELILGDTPGDIVAMREFGSSTFVVYKSDATYIAQATGGAETFAFNRTSAYNVGPAGPNAVLSVGEGLHMYLGADGGVYRFDGVQPVVLSEPLRAFVAQRLDRARMGRSFAFFDPETTLAWFFFPVKGSDEINAAVTVDLASGAAWPMRWPSRDLSCGIAAQVQSGIKIGDLPLIGEMTMTFAEMASSAPAVILGGVDGQCYRETGYTDDGDAIPLFFETGDKPLGNMTALNPVTHSTHRFKPTADTQLVGFEIGVSVDGESLEWEGEQTLDLSEPGAHELGHRVSGLTYALRFSGQATQPVVWLISQIGAYEGGVR